LNTVSVTALSVAIALPLMLWIIGDFPDTFVAFQTQPDSIDLELPAILTAWWLLRYTRFLIFR